MSKMRGYYMMAMGMALAGLGNYDTSFRESEEPMLRESETEKAERLKRGERIRNLKNGLREYEFLEGTLWALNESSAIKKAIKKGFTLSTIKRL